MTIQDRSFAFLPYYVANVNMPVILMRKCLTSENTELENYTVSASDPIPRFENGKTNEEIGQLPLRNNLARFEAS